jgi:hypothetical protein
LGAPLYADKARAAAAEKKTAARSKQLAIASIARGK